MFNDTDTVGYAFKRAFYRVDGVTMYVCWLIWAGILIWAMFDAEASRIEVLVKLMIGLMSPFLYVLLGLMRNTWLAKRGDNCCDKHLVFVGLLLRIRIFDS